jgi:hypothetical protein
MFGRLCQLPVTDSHRYSLLQLEPFTFCHIYYVPARKRSGSAGWSGSHTNSG